MKAYIVMEVQGKDYNDLARQVSKFRRAAQEKFLPNMDHLATFVWYQDRPFQNFGVEAFEELERTVGRIREEIRIRKRKGDLMGGTER